MGLSNQLTLLVGGGLFCIVSLALYASKTGTGILDLIVKVSIVGIIILSAVKYL